ncbi:MAG: Cys-tRNA(Pro) deacylase [Ruminococcaceae bacterium]|nr:Cys-tRNA(Pro) deacylase [Oscillospiraceae bacterium]
MTKTNAMRRLEEAGIPFSVESYPVDEEDLSGVHTAEILHIEDPGCMFKTLVTRGKGGYFVFCIPVAQELDLKKCASAAGEKSVEMIHVKEMLPLTGYIRGGCSPIGMKKAFPTYVDETAILYDEIYVSAGQRGLQLKLNPDQLVEFIGAKYADLTRH